MRKWSSLFVALLVTLAVLVQTKDVSAKEHSWLDITKLDQGVIEVTYKAPTTNSYRVMISKSNITYNYQLASNGQVHSFPLQFGNGDYKVSLLEQVSGNKYKVLDYVTVQLNLADSKIVYLNSIEKVKWNENSKAALKAKELTKNLKSDEDKVKAIYAYITKNIKYDTKLAKIQTPDYTPDPDQVLTSQSATCYGYSSLFAAMLRSVDIPAKLVTGSSAYVTEYHAWNEVFLNGKWNLIDTTVDAGLKYTKNKAMIKESSKYKTAKYY
ncbi:transglutaminase [Paenibacillus sp. CAA11]|uniref:transglutaminase-like domain-containing protein n=1 Tax=Paenibacillus sp. CAA11 TaxID=1532905 RepID=UPI000D3BF3E3|nr:transglutaminase-like domain-containing protein [Paenibacillus sp. CAA11]AWB44568.1 transglutaminase [Paenibacillus sp. CAA11]